MARAAHEDQIVNLVVANGYDGHEKVFIQSFSADTIRSLHDKQAQMGVDFVTLSPVQATATHPEAQPLGWDAASEMLTHCNLPAYLLGGVGPADIERAWQVGAQGVAGIRAFWPASTL